MRTAIANPKIRERLKAVFNDCESAHAASLQRAIENITGIETLKYSPVVMCSEVNENITAMFASAKLVPTLFFADPFGYKGVSLELLSAAIKDFGSDCVFFFNYNRVNAAISNAAVEPHMADLFGADRLEDLRQKCSGASVHEREAIITEELCNAIRGAIPSTQTASGESYVLPFRFRDASGNRTSHHLIFISKHIRGYERMKEIMAEASTSHEQGVPTFEYNEATVRQPFLFEFNRPLDDLENMLCETFAGQQMTMKQIYDAHHVDRRYIAKNYKDALKNLEAANRIQTNPSAHKRRIVKGELTFGDNVQVTFLPKENA